MDNKTKFRTDANAGGAPVTPDAASAVPDEDPRFVVKTVSAPIGVVQRLVLSGLPGIHSSSVFARIVRRERARSDRTERAFALVVVDLREVPLYSVGRAPGILQAEVRELDAVGWVEPGQVGLLLPETDRRRAEIVVRKLRAALDRAMCPGAINVFVYGERCPDAGACSVVPEVFPHVVPADGGAGRRGDGPDPNITCGQGRRADDCPSADRADDAKDGITRFLETPVPRWKRALDIVGSASLLVALWPVMAAVAVAVKRSSPGPIIFCQQRAGLGGRPFKFYKFRTMVDGAEAQKAELLDRNEADGPVFKIGDDPRITPLGHFLRRTSLDELPQLVNVLVGDMTLVGPRPPTLDEVPHYRRWHRRRLDVTGGITCIWQVSGRCTVPFEEWMRMDSRYIQHQGPATDLLLLFKTLGAVISGKGAK